jgi:hypothetical protein
VRGGWSEEQEKEDEGRKRTLRDHLLLYLVPLIGDDGVDLGHGPREDMRQYLRSKEKWRGEMWERRSAAKRGGRRGKERLPKTHRNLQQRRHRLMITQHDLREASILLALDRLLVHWEEKDAVCPGRDALFLTAGNGRVSEE